MAIASLVLGIVWLWWIGSILALVFGYIALGQIKQRHEGGRGMAIAGVVPRLGGDRHRHLLRRPPRRRRPTRELDIVRAVTAAPSVIAHR